MRRETRSERAQTERQIGCKLDDADNGDTLSGDEVTTFRRIAAMANFLTQDSVDIAFAKKKATRRMTALTKDDWNKLVRLGRYFLQNPRVVNCCEYLNASQQVAACTDSDWAFVCKNEEINVRWMHPGARHKPWWR